jgi:hypothetical protein
MSPLKLVAMSGALVMLGACGGPSSPVGSVAPGAVTTVAPTTTAPTTMAPTTTAAPTTTTIDLKAKVIADYAATQKAITECVKALERCDLDPVAVEGSPAKRNLHSYVERLVRNGLRIKRNTPPGYYVVRSVTLHADHSATLVTCALDAGVIYDPRDPLDPTDDAIVNDQVATVRTQWLLRMEASIYKQAEAKVLRTDSGEDTCARAD